MGKKSSPHPPPPPPPPPPGVPGPKNIGQWTSQGCWNDNSSSQSARAIPNNIANGQNINSCVDLAAQEGFNTAALQYGNQCWACNSCNFKKYGSQPPQATQCNINSPGANTNMVYTRTIGSSGFSCNYGNQKIPTIVDSNGIITAPTDYVVQGEQSSCIEWMNSTLIPGQFSCPNGTATSTQCAQLYKDLGIDTYADMGFNSDSHIVKGEDIIGKQDGFTYTCASIDGKNCLKNLNINMQPLSPLKNITCETYNTPVESPTNLCQTAFNYWNLYPSTNPLVIRSRNINQSIPNTITNQSTLNNLASSYQNFITNTNTSQGIINGINTLMENTPIKLACCGRLSNLNETSLNLNVRIPLSPEVAAENPRLKSFDFQRQILTIPENSCPSSLSPNSGDCNAFFGVYCENVINVFNQQNLPTSEFIQYAPECACFAPKTASQQFYPSGTPTICYKDGCSSGTISYLDSTSQGPNAKCDMTVCQNIVNTAGLTAGGSANISPTLQNNCGQYIPPAPSTSTSPSSSTSQSSSTSTSPSSSISPSSSLSNLFGNSGLSGSSDRSNNTYNYIIYVIIIIIIIGIIYYFVNRKTSHYH